HEPVLVGGPDERLAFPVVALGAEAVEDEVLARDLDTAVLGAALAGRPLGDPGEPVAVLQPLLDRPGAAHVERVEDDHLAALELGELEDLLERGRAPAAGAVP